MRIVKMTLGIATLAALLGAGIASATEVRGTLVCANDSTKGLPGVALTFTQGTFSIPSTTDAVGAFGFRIYGDDPVAVPGLWNVTADLSALGGPANAAIATDVYIEYAFPFYQLAPIAVDLPWCGTPPPPPECPELDSIQEGPICISLGNPRSECGYFGLVAVDKDDNTSGNTWVASTTAAVALVKAGGCYNVYKDVEEGDILSKPYTQGISHVTYCGCPE
jgi:hypothetical protein